MFVLDLCSNTGALLYSILLSRMSCQGCWFVSGNLCHAPERLGFKYSFVVFFMQKQDRLKIHYLYLCCFTVLYATENTFPVCHVMEFCCILESLSLSGCSCSCNFTTTVCWVQPHLDFSAAWSNHCFDFAVGYKLGISNLTGCTSETF